MLKTEDHKADGAPIATTAELAFSDQRPPIFIIGSGRSGNTLLRRFMVSTGEIYIPPETYVIASIIKGWRRMVLSSWSSKVRFFCERFEGSRDFATFGVGALDEFATLANALPREKRTLRLLFDAFYLYLARRNGSAARRWGDKTPVNVYDLKDIARMFEGAQFVFLVRNGLDVVASYHKAGLYPNLAMSCERWVTANTFCEELSARRPNQVRRIVYEDMVAEPDAHVRGLFEWLRLSYAPDLTERDPGALGDVEALAHHANTKKPVTTSSVGKWREQISREELAAFPPAFWETMARYGYPGSPEAAERAAA